MTRTRSLAMAAAILSAAACSSTPDEPEESPAEQAAPPTAAPPPAAAAAAEEAEHKIADISNQLEMATRKLERAQMDVDQQKSDADAAVQKATVERDLAKKALQRFDAVESPQKLAKAELDLKDANDQMTEQQEEMQQLELMYEKDDLADKTKEIVLARGKRRLERAKQRLALTQKDYEDLKASQLPEQRTKLAQALKEKEVELARAEFNAKAGRMDKEIAVLAAQQEIEKLGRELEKARKSLAASAAAPDADDEVRPSASVASFLFGDL
jgi:hypothetical protein